LFPLVKEDAKYLEIVRSFVPEEGWKNYFAKTEADEIKKQIGVPVQGSSSPNKETKSALFLRTCNTKDDGKLSFKLYDWFCPSYQQYAVVSVAYLRSAQPGDTLLIEGEGGSPAPGSKNPMKTVLEFRKLKDQQSMFKMFDQSNPWCFAEFEMDNRWFNMPVVQKRLWEEVLLYV